MIWWMYIVKILINCFLDGATYYLNVYCRRIDKSYSEGLWDPLRPSEKYFSEDLWGPQRPSEALRKCIFQTLSKTIARARRVRALEISRQQKSRVQDVKILWSITLMTNFASTSGPRPIPEIRIESTSMIKFSDLVWPLIEVINDMNYENDMKLFELTFWQVFI